MNQPESMNPGLTWPAPLGLGGLQLQASASRSISQKMSLQITVNFQTQVIFRITPCVFVFPDLSFWAIPNCHNASGDYEVLPVVLPSFLCRVDFTQDHVLKDLIAIFDEHSDEPRVSGILPLAKTGWWPNNHPVTAWNKEETHGTLEHRSILIRSSVKGQGSRFFEVSDGQCQNHLEIPWIQHSALPARRPWWHRDWGCEGTWTARSSACSLHSG